ncbi:MAG TPA: hypothetical protein VG297_10910 [Bryobacteraceae bacterium]|jgi:hypothetical protein|nr:hypothetical protein [Bryobacteraceae bacterium]
MKRAMSNIKFSHAGLAAIFLFAGSPGVAQEHPQGFFLTSPLEISSGYDSKFITGPAQITDSVSIVTGPTMSWMGTTHRTDYSIAYTPEVELFAHNPDLNSWNQSATMRMTHRINARWSLNFGDSYLDTTDSNRALVNSLLLLPRGRYRENTFYGELGYRLDHATRIKFRFDNTADTAALPGSFEGRLDYVTVAGTATVDRTLTPSQTLSGSYSFIHAMPLHPSVAGSPSDVHLLSATYTYEVNRGLLLRASGGFVEGAEPAATGAFEVEKAFSGLWTAAGFQRYVGFFGGLLPVSDTPDVVQFANALAPNSVYEVVSLRGWGQLTKRLGMEAAGQKAINGINAEGIGVRSLIGRLRLTYRLTGRYALFTELGHYGQNFNQFSGNRLSENRFFAGIQITLSRPPERENLRGRHGKTPQDSRRDILPPPEEPLAGDDNPELEN